MYSNSASPFPPCIGSIDPFEPSSLSFSDIFKPRPWMLVSSRNKAHVVGSNSKVKPKSSYLLHNLNYALTPRVSNPFVVFDNMESSRVDLSNPEDSSTHYTSQPLVIDNLGECKHDNYMPNPLTLPREASTLQVDSNSNSCNIISIHLYLWVGPKIFFLFLHQPTPFILQAFQLDLPYLPLMDSNKISLQIVLPQALPVQVASGLQWELQGHALIIKFQLKR